MSEYFVLQGPGVNPESAVFGEKHGEHTSPIVDELLYSTSPQPGKHGVTLAPGQGVLLLGTVLAMRDADGLYVKFGEAGAGEAEGVLHRTADTGSDPNGVRQLGIMITDGKLKNHLVVAAGNNAGYDTSLDASVNLNRDTFTYAK